MSKKATATANVTKPSDEAVTFEKPIQPSDAGQMAQDFKEQHTEVTAIKGTAAELIQEYGNKSNAIRALAKAGHTKSAIAKALGIRYQHVNNVLNQPLKRLIKDERENSKGNGNGDGSPSVTNEVPKTE